MPETVSGREKILKWLKENDISQADLSVAYGYTQVYISNVLNGKATGAGPNTLIIKIIKDFQIR